MSKVRDEGPFIDGRRGRRVSDDVQSLDSWGDLESPRRNSSEEVRQDVDKFDRPRDRFGDEILLSPSRLAVIEEPPEPKVTRVKLNKAEPDQFRSVRERPKFFVMPTQTQTDLKHSDEYQHKRHYRHKHTKMHAKDCGQRTDSSPEICEKCERLSLHSSEKNSDMPFQPQAELPRQLPTQADVNTCTCKYCEKQQKEKPWYDNSRYKHFRPHYNQHRQRGFHHGGHKILAQREAGSDFGHDADHIDQSEKVKNKLISVWNNVKYGWTLKTKTNFEKDSPIFLLGSCYHKRPEDDEIEQGARVSHAPSMELFKQDFQSRLWFTYRRDFPTLPSTRFTTDCGWGCMLRSGQMMLAQAFLCHFLGREWRVHNQNKEQTTFYRHIIQWFGDSLSDQCPFSVHRLADVGKTFGKEPGDWYGPSSVSYILRDALRKASLSQPVLKDLCIYVAQDCTVFKQDILDLCTTRPRNLTSSVDSMKDKPASSSADQADPALLPDDTDCEWKRSVIILIPVRLGGEEFNPIYTACIKNLMAQETCIGMIGGKPKHSLYFIGWQEDKLIHLDPHFCQDYVDTLKRDFKIESFHCFSPRKIALCKMDPSATIGFYCRTKSDFNKFVEQTEELVSPKKGIGPYPMFVFNEGRGSDRALNDLSLSQEQSLKIRRVVLDEDGRIRSSTIDSEEFVVL